jgi:hypothetical protein
MLTEQDLRFQAMSIDQQRNQTMSTSESDRVVSGNQNGGSNNAGPKSESQGKSISLIDPVSRKIFQYAAGGIGLVAEAIHSRKQTKVEVTGGSETMLHRPSQSPSQNAEESDGEIARFIESYGSGDSTSPFIQQQAQEVAWQLDEAQDQIAFVAESPPPYSYSYNEAATDQELLAAIEGENSRLASEFLRDHPTPVPETVNLNSNRLSLPVLLTQRRPGKRSRGLIRVYSPLLNDVGIDQATFLDFIDDFNKAVRPNGLIQALNLASIAGLATPDHLGLLIGIAVQVATNIADEIDSRTKTNSFLDQVNDSFFAPRGLIALMISWKPSERNELVTTSSFDLTPAISSAVANSAGRGVKRFNHKFETSNAVSAFEWLETAPLIFPKLDDLVAVEGDRSSFQTKKQNAIKRSNNFVQEYMDRRARAKWAGNHPQSILANAAPKDTFNSIYSDPNHPVSSGDPLALVTGGRAKIPSIPIPFLGRKNSEPTPRDGSSSPSLAGPDTFGKAKNIALPFLSGGLTLLQNLSGFFISFAKTQAHFNTGHTLSHDCQSS